MTSMTASEPVVSLAVSPFSNDSGNKYVFPSHPEGFSAWRVRLLLEEILWDKKYDMDLYRCKDVLSISTSGVGRDQQLPPGHPGRVLRRGRSHSIAMVAMGSQLRLRFEQEVRLLKKSIAKIARRDQRKEEIKS
ncbi:hypothetical protein Tco_0327539 [Tanacetum coccineum]